MKKILWFIIAFLTILNLVVDYAYFNTIQTDFIFGEVLEFIFTLISPLVGGLLIGGLVALIPFKQIKFKKKFQLTMPIIAILIAGIYLFSTTSVAYFQETNSVKFGPVKPYSNIEIPQGLNCSAVKEGLFETDNLIIERKENKKTPGNNRIKQMPQEHSDIDNAGSNFCVHSAKGSAGHLLYSINVCAKYGRANL